MDDWKGKARTNYVTITNLSAVRELAALYSLELVSGSSGKYALLAKTPTGGWEDRTNERGELVPFDFATMVMPYVAEHEVLVEVEIGNTALRRLNGTATAYIRTGATVRQTILFLSDIYQRAADAFGVPRSSIPVAEL